MDKFEGGRMHVKEQGPIGIYSEGTPSNWDKEYLHLYSGKYIYFVSHNKEQLASY